MDHKSLITLYGPMGFCEHWVRSHRYEKITYMKICILISYRPIPPIAFRCKLFRIDAPRKIEPRTFHTTFSL